MQSRRDQVQAHLFVLSRLASGMLRAEPDTPDTPTGRTTRGTVGGLALGVLIALVVTVLGVFEPSASTGWQKPGALVVVNETGARYLYLNGELHPVLNQTSAKLLAGDQLMVRQVAERSIDGTARGGPVGLLGAPDGLPTAAALAGTPAWLTCAVANGKLALAIGPHGEGTALTPGQALLVATPDGGRDLLWQGRRLRLDVRDGAAQALGYAAAAPAPVSAALLDTLPAGPDLAAPDVPGRGGPGPQLAARPTKVGQLFEAPGGGRYLLTTAGLTPLSTLQYELLRGDPRTQKDAYAGAAPTPAAIGPEDLAGHTAPAAPADGLPAEPPALVAPAAGQAVCTDLHPATDPGASRTSVTLLDQTALDGQPPAAQPGVRASCTPADLVAVRPGGGALVRAALAGGSAGDAEFLVAENGVKYAVPSGAAKQLGYAGVVPSAVPAALLALLPAGPSLDPAALTGGGVPAPAAATPC
ncbi:type VII secretion protein EccB [Kitasatospora sp. NPDC006697]|uniref:type VII secretion protein EccB n=1 Tax=Kitasatospora sp. NPDC006697 TaxID=3364020 RepID=UPI0036BD8D69